jgi:hypothetical protein
MTMIVAQQTEVSWWTAKRSQSRTVRRWRVIQDSVRSTTRRRGQHLEGMQVIGPPDDFQRQLRLELARGPGDQLPGVAAVGPGQLDRPRRAQPIISEPLTDCESMIAAVGALVRPAAARTWSRRSSCIRSADPSACHLSARQ